MLVNRPVRFLPQPLGFVPGIPAGRWKRWAIVRENRVTSVAVIGMAWPGRSVSRWGAVLDDIAGIDPEHRLLPETGYSTRFRTSERSHYARVIASSNECCSDTRSRDCEGGVAKTMEALTDALVAPIFLAPPASTSRGIFSAWCRLDRPHRRRARGGPGVSVRSAAASADLRAARFDANSQQLDGKVPRYR